MTLKTLYDSRYKTKPNTTKKYCYIGSIYLSIYLILWHLQHLYLTFLTTNGIEPVLQADVVDERPLWSQDFRPHSPTILNI